MSKSKPRILFLDIETTPLLGWVWGKWKQNVIAFKQDSYMLSFAYRWMGDSTIRVKALCDYPNYSRNKRNDGLLVRDLWKLLDRADIVIAHNGDRFDIRKTNSRLVYHRLPPPSPFKTIDTLKIARSSFRFDGNSLNDLVHFLKLGAKLPHTGFHLWESCMHGNPKAWVQMKEYNIHDIVLLEKVYHRLKAWAKSHPNLAIYSNSKCCPTCQSDDVQKRGLRYLVKRIKQQYNCMNCGAWFTGEFVKK